jgi:hypothetical protein
VRPIAYARGAGADPAEIQFSPSGGGHFRTVRRIVVRPANCYFDIRVRFPASGSVRMAWTYPGAHQIYSRSVPITLR